MAVMVLIGDFHGCLRLLIDRIVLPTTCHRFRSALLFLALISPASVLADGPNLWIEAQAKHMPKGKGGSEVLAWLDGDIKGPFGYFLFANQASDGYRELYGGPTVKPLSWLELGVGIGTENSGNHRRRSAHFVAEGDLGSVSGYFENGASGPAHRIFLNYWLTRSLGLGLLDESAGRGPRVVYRFNGKASVWGAVLRDHSDRAINAVVAVNYQF